MSLTRRRAIQIAACAAALAVGPAPARESWRGVALGAEAEITVETQDRAAARAALAAARDALRRAEALFSLHRPGSALARLNRDGRLARPHPEMLALLEECRRVWALSGGAFDPTVQPLWRALAEGRDEARLAAARALVGWEAVRLDPERIAFDRPGMALTLNGIAQGWATDLAARALAARGFDRALVNVGEFRALGGPWRVGVAGPDGGLLDELALGGLACATSAPGALVIGRDGDAHILDPLGGTGATGWASVTVVATTAARADALSTAVAAAPPDRAKAILAAGGARRALLADAAGRRFDFG